MPSTAAPRDATLDWHRQYPSHPRSVRQARHDTEEALRGWDAPNDVIDAAILVTSELATNAVTHGHLPGHTFELRLGLSGDAVTIALSDASPTLPVLTEPEATAEHGRGLSLITAVAGASPAVIARWPIGKTIQISLVLAR